MLRICQHCKKPLALWQQQNLDQRFCSTACANKYRAEHRPPPKPRMAKLRCYCGKVFEAGSKESRACFCSIICERYWIKGMFFDLGEYVRRHEEKVRA